MLPVITYVITLSNENKETSPMYQRPSQKLEFYIILFIHI